MNKSDLWLVGAGLMAQDYARVLIALRRPFQVIGRGTKAAKAFEFATGCSVETGGVEAVLLSMHAPSLAIVAVDVGQLAQATEALIRAGTRRILLEKPGGLSFFEISKLNQLANEFNSEVIIAYNRRFYHSVQLLRDYIDRDGGLLSIKFEFTEWSHKIAPLEKGPKVKEHWLLGNSSHVIDLAFSFSGKPLDWNCWHGGFLDWHPSAARFCGAGITEQGVMFSYLSDWEAPGRWGLELMTAKRRFILCPMEELKIVQLGSVKYESVLPESSIDSDFKPGLFRQVEAFLSGDDAFFCFLSEQVEYSKIYSRMAGYL